MGFSRTKWLWAKQIFEQGGRSSSQFEWHCQEQSFFPQYSPLANFFFWDCWWQASWWWHPPPHCLDMAPSPLLMLFLILLLSLSFPTLLCSNTFTSISVMSSCLKTHILASVLPVLILLNRDYGPAPPLLFKSFINNARFTSSCQQLNELPTWYEHLYLQADNCWSENKNVFMLGFLSLLVALDIFQKIYLSFLLVGHTHEDIYQLFSVGQIKLKSALIHTPLYMLSFFCPTPWCLCADQCTSDLSTKKNWCALVFFCF